MKAIQAIGLTKVLRFAIWPLVYMVFKLLPYPPCRVWFLRLFGAKIGRNTVIHDIRFLNFYRGSFSHLEIGDDCYIGNEVYFDLASSVRLGKQVSVGEHTMFITHLNVGYADHPLQKYFPARSNPISVGGGSFIGVNSVILDGVSLGEQTFVSASSMVKESFPGHCLIGGVPAKVIKEFEP